MDNPTDTEPDNNRYSREKIEKALLYGSFSDSELYRYYNNLRYFPKAERNPVVLQTLEELKIAFESRGLQMPKWRKVKRSKLLWRKFLSLFNG